MQEEAAEAEEGQQHEEEQEDEEEEDEDEDGGDAKEEEEDEERPLTADERAEVLVLNNLRKLVLSVSSGQGTKTVQQQTMLDCIAAAVMSTQVAEERLTSAVMRTTGLSRIQQARGLQLVMLKEQGNAMILRMPRAPHSHGSKAKKDLDFVYDWFHNDCPLVEVDKSKRNCYRRKIANVAGKTRRLTCQRRIMTGTKKSLVESFLSSDIYSNWCSRSSMRIGEKTAKGCICPCIKEATLLDCVCPMCVEFRYLLKAWHTQRQVWHQATPCRCSGCQGPRWVSRLQLISNNNSCGMFMCACKIPFRIFIFS